MTIFHMVFMILALVAAAAIIGTIIDGMFRK